MTTNFLPLKYARHRFTDATAPFIKDLAQPQTVGMTVLANTNAAQRAISTAIYRKEQNYIDFLRSSSM
jgi:hypothetical protein